MPRRDSGGAIPQLGVASRSNRYILISGIVVAACLIGSTIGAHGNTDHSVFVVKAFVPICATIWCFAEVLTAFLLLSQFYVGGKISFAILAAGYGFSGLLTVPYLAWFPDVFTSAQPSPGDLQVSAWLWMIWHLTFPVAIAAAHVIDGTLDTVKVPRDTIVPNLVLTVASCVAAVSLVTVAVYFGRDHLPAAVLANGEFTTLWRTTMQPASVVINTICLGIVFFRARRIAPLQMWLAIAVLTTTLDSLVNCWTPERYSHVWYVGNFEALVTSVAVLLALLLEVATLYRRLYDVASVDTLTGLANRRSFNESLRRVLAGRQERTSGVALMMLDVDLFKQYNDRFGHAAGDAALATVADALNGSLLRSNDFVARFGGEEFVILLPDVMPDDVERIAERVRTRVARLAILHEASATSHLTISIGAAFCSRHRDVSPSALFDVADRALYAAKARGRNCVVVRHVGDAQRERGGLTLAASNAR